MSRDNKSHTFGRRDDLELRDLPEPNMDHRHNHDHARHKVRVSAGSQPFGEQAPSVTDTLQNARMDAIERAIRELTEDLARNRATFGQVMDELRDTNHNGVPDALERRGSNDYELGEGLDREDIAELVYRVERSVHTRFKELARAWSVLGDRLKALEDKVEEVELPDISGVQGLSPDLEASIRSLASSDHRLEKLEKVIEAVDRRVQTLAVSGSSSHDDDRFEKLEKLTEAVDRRLQTLAASGISSFDTDRLVKKFESVERLIADNSGGNLELGPVMSGLRDVEDGLRGIGAQVRDVDNRTGDVNLLVDAMSERQQRLEDIIRTQQDQIADLLKIVRDDLDPAVLQSAGPDSETLSAIVGGAVSERFNGLSTSVQHRLSQLEDLVKGAMDRPVVVNGSGDADTGYLSDAVGKIINNQHTLASSIDEWRGQVRDDMVALRTRVDNLDSRPEESNYEERFREISDRLQDLQTKVPHLQDYGRQPVQEPQDGWSRFKIWLYGTTDWYGVSWGGEREDGATWTARDRAGVDGASKAEGEAIYARANGNGSAYEEHQHRA